MKQFNLKFTEQNLEKHLAYDPIWIKTLRDEMKGECGDLTIINSEIYFVYEGYTTNLKEIQHSKNNLWKEEGFSSQKEYVDEIKRIYGDDETKRRWVMVLCRLHGCSSVKWIRNPVTFKRYPIRDRSSKPLKNDIKGLWEEEV